MNITRHPRQMTKGTIVENGMGATRSSPLCLWGIREKAQKSTVPLRQKPCRNFEPAMSPSGNTRPRHFGPVVPPCGNTRPREHDANPRPRFLASGSLCSLAEKTQKSALTAPKKWFTPDGANLSLVALDVWVCNIPVWEHQSSALWACGVPLREHQASGA